MRVALRSEEVTDALKAGKKANSGVDIWGGASAAGYEVLWTIICTWQVVCRLCSVLYISF